MEEADQTSLFDHNTANPGNSAERESGPVRPLAVRMRPKGLAGIVGQDHILGKGCLLPRLIKADSFGSILLWGPPGSGKTTLAQAVANESSSRFISVSAVLSNVAEIRDILRFARSRPQDRTILFIDEIHRFNKAQQDLLLPDVETGDIRLIGATTHNPGFYVIAPLLSRSHLFRLEPIPENDVIALLKKALKDVESGIGARRCKAGESVLRSLAKFCDGDLRRAFNSLETLALSLPEGADITEKELAAFARERQIRYDANEDEHYSTISAYIKSMRGCDPDAALYWLAKMLAGGEDPRFIARRLVILASEDIGMADPRALPMTVAAFHACDFIGMPECEYHLAHATIFLATAPKSNSVGNALSKAKKALREEPVQKVPVYLQDAGPKMNKLLGHNKEYMYSHEYPEAISGQEYLENPLSLYHPNTAGAEAAVAERLARWKKLKKRIHHKPQSDKGTKLQRDKGG